MTISKFRNKLIAGLLFLSAACLSVGVGMNVREAKAQDTQYDITESQFSMVKGASVRIDLESEMAGLKYAAEMPKASYEALKAEYPTASFGILIAPSSYSLTKENVFGDSAIYDWAEKNELGEWVYSGTKTRIMNFETDQLWYNQTDDVMYYAASIVDIKEENLPRQFVGKAYVAYETATGTDYYFATENDNTRSIYEVAKSALADVNSKLEADEKAWIQTNYIEKSKKIIVEEFTAEPVCGDTVTLPTAIIDGGEVAATVAIEGAAVALTEGAFTANVAGDYVVTYTATVDGIDFKETLTIPVARGAYKANEIISFTEKSDLSKVSGATGEWLPSYEGANGVLKLDLAAWADVFVKPVQDASVYQNVSGVTMRIFLPSQPSGQIWLDDTGMLNSFTVGIWYDCYFSCDMWHTDNKSVYIGLNSGEYYIDEISFDVKEELPANTVRTFTTKKDMDLGVKSSDSSMEWLESYEGKTGVVKMTANNWGYFGFIPVHDMSSYTNVASLVIRMYIADDAAGTVLWFGNESGKCSTAVETGKWVDYYFDGATFLSKWANSQTDYYIWTMAMSVSNAGTYYIDEIFVVEKEEAAANVVRSFNTVTDMNASTSTYDSSLEWLESYEGKTGVVKMTAKAWGYFGFIPVHDMSSYTNVASLVIRMYIADDAAGTVLWFGNESDKCSTAVETGKWVDYYFDGATFLSKWANSQTSYDIWTMAMSVSNAGTYYIDEIFVVYNEAA